MKKVKEEDDLASRHAGIIYKLAYIHWRRLPPQVAAYMSFEDMVHEAQLEVLSKQQHYDSDRAQSSTFIWRVVDNHLREIVNRYFTKKRMAREMVDLDSDETVVDLAQPDNLRKLYTSKKAVENILREASEDLRDALENFLVERRYRRWRPEVIEEVRTLSRKHGVRYQDFDRVLRGV